MTWDGVWLMFTALAMLSEMVLMLCHYPSGTKWFTLL